jgi:hypothetical protein
MIAYRVRDWSKHFENNRTRELKELRFVILPNKHDGDGYTELLDHPNGAAHYGAWCSIVQVASKCDPRGTLLRDGARPHDSSSLSRLTRIPKEIFDEALPRLISVGWLSSESAEGTEQSQQTQADREIPQECATLGSAPDRTPLPESAPELNRTEENRKGRKDKRADKPPDPRVSHPAIQAVWKIRGKYPLKELWDMVIETVGSEPDEEKMKSCWIKWRGRGFSPENYGWLTDWYVNGEGVSSNGTYTQNNGLRRPSAAERNNSQLMRNLAVVQNLRREGRGDTD